MTMKVKIYRRPLLAATTTPDVSGRNDRHIEKKTEKYSLSNVILAVLFGIEIGILFTNLWALSEPVFVINNLAEGFIIAPGDGRECEYSNPANKHVTEDFTKKKYVVEIATRFCGETDKLMKFAGRLGISMANLTSDVAIRWLITSCDDDALQKRCKFLAALEEMSRAPIKVVPIKDMKSTSFSRAKALNTLTKNACGSENCYFSMMDVDMEIKPSFIENMIRYLKSEQDIYYPIVWSEYDPVAVLAAETIFGKQRPYTEQRGMWRKGGYGMWAMKGARVRELKVENRTASKWGGEDNELFAMVKSKYFNIVRENEPGLIHKWHDKVCSSEFVDEDFVRNCIAARDMVSGSDLIRDIREKDPEFFGYLVYAPPGPLRTDPDEVNEWLDHTYKNFRKKTHPKFWGELVRLTTDGASSTAEESNIRILVAVVSSRQNFGSRVKTLVSTWGDPQNIPQSVTIRYFVGEAPTGSEFYGKPEQEIAHLAQLAGITDCSTIVVMDGVVDDEYPPVRKNTAMLQYLERFVEMSEQSNESPSTFNWIMKVDDDTYLNIDAMVQFLARRKYNEIRLYGRQGFGRNEDKDGLKKAGLLKPFCMGGPGYVMSRATLQETSAIIQQCVYNADISQYKEQLWHSDVVIGMCIYNATGAGCWDDHRNDYYNKYAFVNLDDPGVFATLNKSKYRQTITMHPLKTEASMQLQHSLLSKNG
jgi:hypothetical protein